MAEVAPKDAAEALGVSERTVHFWLARGEIEGAYQTITGRWFVTLGALEKFVELRAARTRNGGRAQAHFQHWIEQEGGRFVA